MRFSFVILALVLSAPQLSAQNPRADVRRFQWNPVVVHVAAEATLGVEIYESVKATHWGLTWINPDSLAAWLPQVKALMSSDATADSTSWVIGRDRSELRVVKAQLRGREAYVLELSAPPSAVRIDAWLPRSYLADLTKALEKSVFVARKLEHLPSLPNAQRVYEEWEVDSLPVGAERQKGFSLPSYMTRASVVVGFVVAADGVVVPSSVTVYDCDDPNVGQRWASAVVAWKFTAGTHGGEHVATRVREYYSLENGLSFTINPDRVTP